MTDFERWKANPTPENRDAFLSQYSYLFRDPETRGEVWLTLERLMHSFDPAKGSFTTYVYHQVRILRTIKRYRKSVHENMPARSTGDALDLLRQLLKGFKQRERYIVIAFIDGESAKEIAASLGVSYMTVAAALQKVRKRAAALGYVFKPAKINYYAMLTPEQRARNRERAKQWRLKNKEEQKEKLARYYQEHKEEYKKRYFRCIQNRL